MENSQLKTVLVGGVAVAAVLATGFMLRSNFCGAEANTLTDTDGEGTRFLTKEEAVLRSVMISDVDYQLSVCLRKGGKTYLGFVKTTFRVQEPGYLFIDFKGKAVKNLLINGEPLPSGLEVFNRHRIQIPWQLLKEDASNTISMQFEVEYSLSCAGMQYFKDNDGEEYLYTNACPDQAHKWFPCFDQPNLKATYDLAVVAPTDWKVISTCALDELLNPVESLDKFLLACKNFGISKEMLQSFGKDQIRAHIFPKSKRISTYLYCICAGPYHEFSPEKHYSTIPMKLYCRQTLKKHVEKIKEDWFKVTGCGIKWYEEMFEQPYPFKKFDQVLCPEFQFGAMENVGCVTYRDEYVPKDEKITKYRWEKLCVTILHEISHMWFGNLVTMEWWDDLWLNEAFATMIAVMCQSRAKGLEDLTLAKSILLDDIFWGLRTDQADTSHPIQAICKSTADAEDIIDGISYGKGAAWLNQMVYLIEEPAFFTGLRSYFKKYSFENTTLSMFADEMQEAQEQLNPTAPLEGTFLDWLNIWTKTAGCNVIKIVEINGAKVLVQEPYNRENTVSNVNRCQKFSVAYLDTNLQVMEEHMCLLRSDIEEVPLPKSKDTEPTAILLNYGGQGYGKYLLDENSFQELEKRALSKLDDRTKRLLIYKQLFDMTKSGHAAGSRVLTFMIKNIPDEDAEEILLDLLKCSVPALIQRYVPTETQDRYNEQMFEICIDLLRRKKFETESTTQMLIEGALKFCASEPHKELLVKWFESGKATDDQGRGVFEGLTVMHRHTILRIISSSKSVSQMLKNKLLDKMKQLDNSDTFEQTRDFCEAATPAIESKRAIWKKLFGNGDLRLTQVQMYCEAFRQFSQRDILGEFDEKFFEQIYDLVMTKTQSLSRPIYFALQPSTLTSSQEIARFESFQSKIGQKEFKRGPAHDRFAKWVAESLYGLRTTKRARELSGEWEQQKQVELRELATFC